MKKIITLLVVAICLVSCNCNSFESKMKKLDKACEAENLEKAEAIMASIDKDQLTPEQAAVWTEAAMKVSALKTKKLMEEAGEAVKDAAEEVGEKVQEALEDVSEEAKQTIEEAAQKVEEAVQE